MQKIKHLFKSLFQKLYTSTPVAIIIGAIILGASHVGYGMVMSKGQASPTTAFKGRAIDESDLATPNIINIKIKKGITQRVNKFFLKKRVEAKNYYIIYHDVKSNDVWNIRYGGKNINIENNLTDITFEFVNIADREFVRTINYMLYIINEVANRSSKIGKESIIKNLADNTKKGAMKKMKVD
jgi:hypothetical protein